MKQYILFFNLFILATGLYAQTEIIEIESNSRNIENADIIEGVNKTNFLPDTVCTKINCTSIDKFTYDFLTNEDTTGTKDVESLKNHIRNLNYELSKEKNTTTKQAKKLSDQIAILQKDLANRQAIITAKDSLIKLQKKEILELVKKDQSEELGKIEAELKKQDAVITKIAKQTDSIYKIDTYSKAYDVDTTLKKILKINRKEEDTLITVFKNNLAEANKNLGGLKQLLDATTTEKPADTTKQKELHAKIHAAQNTMAANLKSIYKIRNLTIDCIATKKKTEEKLDTSRTALDPVIGLLAPTTSARILPQISTRWKLNLKDTKNGSPQDIDANVFFTQPEEFVSDSAKYQEFFSNIGASLFAPERSTLGIKLSYTQVKKLLLTDGGKKSTDDEHDAGMSVGYTTSAYYLNKKIPVIDESLKVSDTKLTGFAQLRTGFGLGFYENRLQLSVNGNYLLPLDHYTALENFTGKPVKDIYFTDASFSGIFNMGGNLNSRFTLNFIVNNGDIKSLTGIKDRVITTLGVGLGLDGK